MILAGHAQANHSSFESVCICFLAMLLFNCPSFYQAMLAWNPCMKLVLLLELACYDLWRLDAKSNLHGEHSDYYNEYSDQPN